MQRPVDPGVIKTAQLRTLLQRSYREVKGFMNSGRKPKKGPYFWGCGYGRPASDASFGAAHNL